MILRSQVQHPNVTLQVVDDDDVLWQVKPLGVIWGKFPHWSRTNTLMVDDLRRNFIMNPQNGLKVVCFITVLYSNVSNSLQWPWGKIGVLWFTASTSIHSYLFLFYTTWTV